MKTFMKEVNVRRRRGNNDDDIMETLLIIFQKKKLLLCKKFPLFKFGSLVIIVICLYLVSITGAYYDFFFAYIALYKATPVKFTFATFFTDFFSCCVSSSAAHSVTALWTFASLKKEEEK